MKKVNPHARRRARRLALQALYQWHFTGNDLSDIEVHLVGEADMKKVDSEYFHELLHTIPAQLSDIDSQFEPHLDRAIKDVGPIELAILRIATYELTQRTDIPYKVAINEALELAKIFGADESFKFINGVLDKVAKQ